MNIRTPKRYRRIPRRSIFPVRTFLLLLVTVGVVFGASRVMEQRDTIQAQVGEVAQSLTENLSEQIATLNAPPPTATQTRARTSSRATTHGRSATRPRPSAAIRCRWGPSPTTSGFTTVWRWG